jgi:hypothetical protein
MRLNRGTIALIVVALLVIVGVAVFNNNQAAAPGANTPTPAQTSGPLWQGLDQNNVTRLEVRDNHTGQAIVLGKASNGGWDVVDSGLVESASTGTSSVTYAKPQNLPIDTSKVGSTVTAFAGFQYADKFDSTSLADFGLDKPLYTIYASTSTGAIFAIHVGNKNPNNTRYYVTVEQIQGASVTPESTDMQQPNTLLDQGNASTLPAQTMVPPVTEQVGANPTINALATQIVEASSEAEITEAAVAISTAVSATNAAVGTQVATQNATAAATADATSGVAVATEEARVGSEQTTGGTVIAPTAVSSPEATAATAATAEATFSTEEATAIESTPEATPVVLAEPLVELTGNQTIYLLPQDVVAGILAFIGQPPYIYPTATPTLPPTANPYSEVQQTATAAMEGTSMQGTMSAIIATATARAVTPEATAAVTAAPAGGTAEATP